jgi:PhnB protein
MIEIIPYLTFNGNCREAMSFYRHCLGGELHFQTIGETPVSEKLSEKMKECILQATLIKDDIVIMATDIVNDEGLLKGNNVSLMLHCQSEDELRNLFRELSYGGEQTHHIENNFWGVLIGNLTDKYGNQWVLNCKKSPGRKTK